MGVAASVQLLGPSGASISPQYRHLIAAARMVSAQNGQALVGSFELAGAFG